MSLVRKQRSQLKLALAICGLIILNLFVVLGQTTPVQAAINPARLLYIGTDRNLYSANIDGSNKRTLTAGGQVTSPFYSPDGSKIAYLTTSGPGRSTLYITNADGSSPRKIADNPVFFRGEAWSPDSSRITYTTTDGVFTVNADGSNSKQVSQGKGEFSEAYWSPTGSKLVFAKVAIPNNPSGYKKDVFTVNPDGSGLSAPFNINGFIYGYWYDGQRIFYADVPENATSQAQTSFTITLIKPDGTNKQAVPNSASGLSHEFSLSPGGNQVLVENLQRQGAASRWAVIDLANPTAPLKYLELTGNDPILRADWAIEAGKIYAMVVSISANKVGIEEITVATNARRPIVNVPINRPANTAPPPFFSNFTVDPTGYVAFTNEAGATSIADINGARILPVNDAGRGYEVRWQPNIFLKTLPEFYSVWYQSDAAVALGSVKSRSWLWGPEAFADKTEQYKEAKGGQRQVQYFDKARMELNNPDADRGNPFFVTNGLLPKELISGFLQVGDNEYQQKTAAEINVAGDPNGSVTYAKLGGVVTLRPETGQNVATNRTGQAVTATIDRDGNVTDGQPLAGVTLAQFVPQTQHNIPNVFVDYFKTLPQDWVFVMGYPISEPYQTTITLAGKPTIALIQVFERRVLTYTPSNPDAFKVEQGNVGRHYYQWRYGNAQ